MDENDVARVIVDVGVQGPHLPAPHQQRLGLLINFNVALIKDGISRVANGMPT